MSEGRDLEGDRRPVASEAAGRVDARALIHEFNNLLAGLLNSVELLRRSKNEQERDQAVSLIASAGARMQSLVPDLRAAFLPDALPAAPGPKANPARSEDRPVRKILIAEDEEMNRTLLRRVLDGTGRYETAEARDGIETVELYKTYRPDLLLLDIGMPGLSGTQVLERINRSDPGARVLLLSGYITAQDPITRSPNVVGFLQKPVEVPTLLKTLDRLLG